MRSVVKLLRISALAAAIAPASGALAQEETKDFSARGLGALACSDLLTMITGPERDVTSELIVAWMAGYISHANRITPETYDIVPVQDLYGVATVLARICERNPSELVEPMANLVVNAFQPLAVSEAGEVLEISNDTTTIRVARSVVQQVQDRLIERGLMPAGSADGQFGPMTRTALTEFQEGLGATPTGIPDVITVFLLVTTS